MPKTKRQLDREIAEALSGHPQTAAAEPLFKIHGARRGVNKVEHAETLAEAERIAREMTSKGFLITVFTKDPHTQETRVVMLSNRIRTPDASFAGAPRRTR